MVFPSKVLIPDEMISLELRRKSTEVRIPSLTIPYSWISFQSINSAFAVGNSSSDNSGIGSIIIEAISPLFTIFLLADLLNLLR